MHISQKDEILVKGCIANNRSAQEGLYRKYFDIAKRMCIRYTQDEDVLITVINDGFLRIFKNISKYEGKGSFEGWIKRLIFNALSDYFRKENRRQKLVSIEYAKDKKVSDIIENLYLEDLKEVVNQLSKTTQEVFILYAIEGYTHKEISIKLSIAEGTSKWHLNKARNTLQSIIKKKKLNIHYG